MAYTQPILNGTNLPAPSEYKEQRQFRGAMAQMADGSVAFDLVNTAAKRVFTLTWKLLSDANKVVIESVYDAMMMVAVDFTSPSGAAATVVTRTENEIAFDVVNVAAGLRWNVSMELREV